MSRGKYLQFVDSDDYLDPNATRLMVEKAEVNQADMVISHYFRVETEKDREKQTERKKDARKFWEIGDEPPTKQVTTRYGFLDEGFYTKIDFAKNLMKEPASFYYGVMWNKLYRRDLVMEHNIRCSEELTWSEDLLFNLEYIRYAERFYALETPIYYYVNNPTSFCASQMTFKNTITTKASLFAYYKNLYEELGLYEENKLQIYKYLVAVAEA
ncbi:glycosyltransferase, group 2 family protein [gut metagenome]|uniref:Glycosyltransferase, group 2 family protein n=1 Tax=gut metagenome TaxID=749906 RepID=J9FY80_9ZZZZ